MQNFKDLSSINENRPGIVHRLDKDTSGLIVVAKNNTAHQELAKQFKNHSISRKYLANVLSFTSLQSALIFFSNKVRERGLLLSTS